MANYSGSHAIVKNCTFSGNSAIGGGGIRNYSSSPTVTNCILWDNQPDEISSQSSSPAISYCDIQDWIGGTGNINADPNFVDADNPDPELVNLRLNPDSPCIDAGNTAAVTAGVFADLDGNTRVVDDPTKPDIGNPVLGMPVDMGAYEFNPCVIEGDINCDGQVDLFDWCIFCQHWLDGIGTS